MKKKILTLALALTLSFAMSITASAAGSVTAPSVANKATSSAPSAELATTTQQFSEATIAEFATTTTIQSDVNATVSAVSTETAKATIAQAKAVVGANAFVASIVDVNVPAGTTSAKITLGCPNVWAGQSVTILHQKADGSWETIKPDSVANNSVTFTMTSFSPVAIVIDATAPKTGDAGMMVSVMAVLCLAAAVVCSKKARA